MKRTVRTLLTRPLISSAIAVAMLAASAASVGATSYPTTTIARTPRVCGVVANPNVRVISSGSICVIALRRGANVRVTLRSGFRWGVPTSDSRAVSVTDITRDAMGVDGVTLHGAAVGRATIRTTGTVYCKPGVACPDLALLWSMKVVVTKTVSA
jgi:hypothetical protein